MALTLHDKLGGWNPTAPGVPGTAANWADLLLPSVVPPGKAITKKKYIGIRMMSLTPRLVTGRLFCLCLKFTYLSSNIYLFKIQIFNLCGCARSQLWHVGSFSCET